MDLYNKTHAPQMPPFTADVDAQQNVSGEKQPVSKAKMQHLDNDFHSILEITKESPPSASSHADHLPGYSRDHTAEGNRSRTAIEDSASLMDKAQRIDCTNRRTMPYRVAPANDH